MSIENFGLKKIFLIILLLIKLFITNIFGQEGMNYPMNHGIPEVMETRINGIAVMMKPC